MITNSTNKMIKLNRGCVVAKIEPIECNLTTTLTGKISIKKSHLTMTLLGKI